MNPAFEKEFAIPRRTRRWSIKGFADGFTNHASGWMDDQQHPRMAPIETISTALGNENFKWTPEKKQNLKSTEYVPSWTMPFMKLRVLLCLIGAQPLKWRKPHSPSYHLLHSNMLYCIAVYSAISVSVIFTSSDLIQILANESLTPDMEVMVVEININLISHFITPMLWLDTRTQAEGFEVWSSLTNDFYRITGKRLQSRRQGLEIGLIVTVIVFPSFAVMTSFIAISGAKLSYLPSFMHSMVVQCAVAFIWIGTCISLGDVADDITAAFKESTDRSGATSEILVEYRRLWVMLRSVSDLMGDMIAPLLLVTHTLVLITLFLYEGLVFINRNESFLGVFHLCGSGLLVTQLFFICRASHYTALHMKLPLEEVLDTLPVATLSTTAEREVIMFYLVENAKPAVTTLNGFVIVNKSLFSSMLAAVSTYLIVLMQFHQSSDGFSSKNSTVSFI